MEDFEESCRFLPLNLNFIKNILREWPWPNYVFVHNLHALCMTSLLIPHQELFTAVVCHSIKQYFVCRLDCSSKIKKQ